MKYRTTDLPNLRQYARGRDLSILEAVIEHGGQLKAARKTGVGQATVSRTMNRLLQVAETHGYNPGLDHTHIAPNGYTVKGVSTYYDKDGVPKGQWVKTREDREKARELILGAMVEAMHEYTGKAAPVAPPKKKFLRDDLLSVYPIGDPHLGMYAWFEETGEDFDVDIATRDLTSAMSDLVSRSADSSTAIILPLGDMFHSDNNNATTARSGNHLDVDTRWARVLRMGAGLMIDAVAMALEKHDKVIVKVLIGNHDDHTSQALALALDLFYKRERRVHVDISPAWRWYYQFGKVLIGATHGDKTKPDALPAIMADEEAQAWGSTEFRYWYTGHIHRTNKTEYRGCVWESFRTLASPDAWHSSMGYKGGRDMQCIVHHKDYGEVERHTVSIKQARRDK